MRKADLMHGLFYDLPVLAYAGLIFFLSSLSSLPEPIPLFPGLDKLEHITEYWLFGCLILRSRLAGRPTAQKGRTAVLAVAVGLLYALSDEWHQSFVPGRDDSPWDVLADVGGLLLASLTYPACFARFPLLKNVEAGIERICRHAA